MRGISPVIATVLLLLMAVAAVGGAWIWYQRMQATAAGGGSSQVSELRTRTGAQVFISDISNTASKVDVIVANGGTEKAAISNVTAVKLDGTVFGYNDNGGTSVTINPDGSHDFNITKACSSGTILKISVYSGNIKYIDKYTYKCT